MKQNAQNLLESLRGGKWICGCGKVLSPLFNAEGKRIGVTHKSVEDDDWHNAYFSGIRIIALEVNDV